MPAGPVDEMPPVRNHQFRPVAESYNPARCDSVKVTLRIAAVQAEASPGEVNHNIAKAVDFIQRASSEKVDVIVFPEAFVTGYDDAAFTGSLPASAELDWLDRVQEAVDVTGLLVILNTALDRGGRSTLTDIVLAPGRAPVLAYDKQHLYDSERRWFTAGDHGCSLSAGDLKLGLSVCYDANFPEHAAAAAFNGAVVYINSGAYFPGGEHRRDLHYAARALDNGMYVVFSGLIGGTHQFIGGSAVFNPLGQRIAHVPTAEGMAIADIDPNLISRIRSEQPMWADRRVSLGEYEHH